MTAHQIMFMLLSSVIVIFSVLTVTSRRILRAAVYLLFVLVATGGLYFMLNYEFLAAVQLALYAGGIVVLIIFSVLLTSHIGHKFEKIGLLKSVFTAIAVSAGAILSIVTILNYQFGANAEVATEVNMKVIGTKLLSYGDNGYVLPFEVISVLLLAAMVAAIVIAKKGGPGSQSVKNTNQ
jgi:NADH-quinone oxidoreductase subunit J